MYFDNFPKIDYNFITNNGQIEFKMQDVFRSVRLTEDTLKNPANFLYHIIDDGDTPEMVSFNVYGDSSYWWVVLLSNNIIDIEKEWPKSTTELNRLFSDVLIGSSYYIMEDLDIRKNDVVVKRDTSMDGSIDINVWGIIDDYDTFYHKIDVKEKNSSGILEPNDEFYIYRGSSLEGYEKISGYGQTACAVQGVGETACVEILGPTFGFGAQGPYCPTAGSTFSIVRKKTTIKNGLSFFESNEDEALNAYSLADDASPTGATADFYQGENNICGLTGTLLYLWIDDNFPINTNVKAITKSAKIIRDNDDKRKIKVISPSVLEKVLIEFDSLISKKNVPPGTTKYISIK
tara:strand:- start:179 stop:1219 length:1041 start_codon:yes stop_codon:yes gene_type:complete